MSLFETIIVLSMAVTIAAFLGGMAGIVILALRQRREKRHARLRGEILRRILEGLDQTDWDVGLQTLMRSNPAISADLVSEISELIKGEDRDHVLALCREAEIDKWFLRGLKSWKVERRRLAADALKLFPDKRTTDALHGALDDRAEDVRLTAALSLATLNAMPPLPVVMQKLVVTSNMESLLLQRIIDSVALNRPEEVLGLASKSGKPFILPMELNALGKAGHLELGRDIARFIDDADPVVRVAALTSVAALGFFGAKNQIKRSLNDPIQFVRVAAIAATQALELRDLTTSLTKLLTDENWWVRFRAGETLAAFGHPVPQPKDRIIGFQSGSE